MKQQLSSERKKLLRSLDRLLEGPMIFLGFVWLTLLVVELLWGISEELEYVSLAIWGIFIFDFIVKIILAPAKISFLKKNWLTIVSLLIPALRTFRLIRVIRLLRGLRGIRLVRIITSLNRSLKSLRNTMRRRGVGYILLITSTVIFAGAAGMYALESPNPGFDSFGMALWWTAMRVITAGTEFYPLTTEGRSLGFLIAVFGYTIFGYITATFASFFIGRDAEENDGPVAGSKDLEDLKSTIVELSRNIKNLEDRLK